MVKKAGLGRGLGAILQGNDTIGEGLQNSSPQPLSGVNEIDIELITVNPNQPRTHFNDESLAELSLSISRNGIIQPITLRLVGSGKYQIISGERRYRASKLAGLKKIPAYIRNANDETMLELALVENIQREDLDAIEIAISFQRLLEECNLTQESLAHRVAKKRSTVANYLRLLNLPAEIQLALREKKLSMGHARALAGIEDEKLLKKIFLQILEKDLSVRQVEELARAGNKSAQKRVSQTKTPDLSFEQQKIQEDIEHLLGTNVLIQKSTAGSGKIVISYNSDSDLQRIADLLGL
jgi:ParB family chromosome partitioning protein